MEYDLDLAISLYLKSKGAENLGIGYETYTDPGWSEFGGIAFSDWSSEDIPSPSKALLLAISKQGESEGAFLTDEAVVNGFLQVSSTVAFSKIVLSAEKRSHVMVYGGLAISALTLYLKHPSTNTEILAKRAWSTFGSVARRYRSITLVNEDDVKEFNDLVLSSPFLPDWLKLPKAIAA